MAKVELVVFHAPWCGPCQMMKPVIKKISEDYVSLGMTSYDIDTPEGMAVAEKIGVMSVPTIIVKADGMIERIFNGIQTEEAIKKVIDNVVH